MSSQTLFVFLIVTYMYAKAIVAEILLQLLGTHLPPANKSHKIYNSNTVKVSYSCTQNISQIIKGHNKKVSQIKWNH